MGCGVSSAVVAQKRNRQRPGVGSPRVSPNSPGGKNQRSPLGSASENKLQNPQLFDTLVNGVKKIASPGNMMPSVCLTREAFPLALHCVHLEDSTPTGIQLPTVTCSQAKNARIMVFSQINFLQPSNFRTCDTQRLILNSINWLSGGVTSMVKIALVGFTKSIGQTILKVFHDLNIFAELYNERNKLDQYHLIICLSDLNMDDKNLVDNITSFIDNGGGLMVFHKHDEMREFPFPINELLVKYGLSFTFALLNENNEESTPITMPPSFTQVRDNNFVLLSARFKAIIGQSSIDTTALDDIVTLLRYYIMVTDESHLETLNEIYRYSWEYLLKTNYSTAEGLCPDIKHGIIVVLIQELVPKLPITIYTAIKEHEIFPGKTGNVPLGEFDVDLSVMQDVWIATGLWLPAGQRGVVEVQGEYPQNLQIQVGSHQVSLLAKNGALKRWPSVVSFFTVKSAVTEIGTSFGGIVYVTCPMSTDTMQIKMHFSNFCLYPRVCVDDPSVWESTKDYEVPWGEIETPQCIFTLPTPEIKKIEDFNVLSEKFSLITDKIAAFMSYQHPFPYRIVFDVEVSQDSGTTGYPLNFLTDEIYPILHSWDKPTPELFQAISTMSVMSLRENCFDSTTEDALSHICAGSVMQALFPNFQPSDLELEMPPLFNELWEIYTNAGPNVIPQTLGKFQQNDYQLPEIPEDMWISFVKELCEVAQMDFTKLLDRVKPIPLNISISLHGLPVYTPSGSNNNSGTTTATLNENE